MTLRRRLMLSLTVTLTFILSGMGRCDSQAFAQADSPADSVESKTLAEKERAAKLKKRDRSWKSAQSAREKENYPAAIKTAEATLAIERELFGNEHAELIGTLQFLSECHEASGDFTAAKSIREDLVQRVSHAYGADNYRVVDAKLALEAVMTRAGLTPKERQRLARAEAENSRVVRLYRQGEYEDAVKLARRVLETRQTVLGDDHPDTATSLSNLALLYDEQGNYADAESLKLQSLKIREKVLGPDHPLTALSLNNLASHYESRGNYADAEPLYQRALKICKKALSPYDPSTAGSLNNLAGLYRRQGNYAAAEPLYQRALKINEKALGPVHPSTALSLSNLSLFQWDRDQADEAGPLAERALAINLRQLDATAAIQTEQQQFLNARDISWRISLLLTIAGVDTRSTSTAYRDALAWKGLITARQQGLRRDLKDDPLLAEFRRVSQQWSTVSLSPPLPPSDLKALAAWRTREPELRQI